MRKIMTNGVKKNRVFGAASIVLVLVSFMLMAGCQKKAIVQPEVAQPSTQQPDAMQQQRKDTEKIREQKVESVKSDDMESRYAEEKRGMFADILFDYDKYDIKDAYKPEMRKVSEWMAKNSPAVVSIEGHCDERGTNEYNLALGDRRARSVKDYLVSLGVPSSRIETISYGEEKPACTEQNEGCWAKNRRAHFVILMKAGK